MAGGRPGLRLPSPACRNTVLGVQNVVPVERAVAARTLQDRADTYADEVRRLVDATYAVMRRSGSVDPRVVDIVQDAGLSNQAFYRHFRGKDELLLAVLEDGQRRLVTTLERRMARAARGAGEVQAWIEGVLEQARNPEATASQRERVVAPLRDAVEAAGGDRDRDANAVYALTMGLTEDAIARGIAPTDGDVAHTVTFVLRAIGVESR